MRLTVFGAGYVGLVTGAGLAELGHDVLIVDIDAERVARLREGKVPIHEPGLPELIQRNVRGGRLEFATTVVHEFNRSDAYFIAVGTPSSADGSADVRAVLEVAKKISEIAQASALVVVKSTVPVGTCHEVSFIVNTSMDPNASFFDVVSNPEFLKEGSALADFFRPDRVVVGASTEEAIQKMRALYAPLQLSGENVIATDLKSSELTKYAANTMLAMRISFMNEMSRLCHATGADVRAVRLGIGSDARIGRKFLYAGPGWGGSCFGKDVNALIRTGDTHGVGMSLARATVGANDRQSDFVTWLIEDAIGPLEGKTVALWGLAFKPETDDVRDAPSVKLTRWLQRQGAHVVGHDPEAGPNFVKAVAGPFCIRDRDFDALDGADALVLLTEWRSYLAPDFHKIKARMRGNVVIDTRNVWRSVDVTAAGLKYQGVGTR